MRLKTIAMLINPELAKMFDGGIEEEDEASIVQWAPETELDVQEAMADLKKLGILH